MLHGQAENKSKIMQKFDEIPLFRDFDRFSLKIFFCLMFRKFKKEPNFSFCHSFGKQVIRVEMSLVEAKFTLALAPDWRPLPRKKTEFVQAERMIPASSQVPSNRISDVT